MSSFAVNDPRFMPERPRTPDNAFARSQCYCSSGVMQKNDDMYCSTNCARNQSLSHSRDMSSIGSRLADALKAHRDLLQAPFDEDASYRRMARADQRREERREERRRRRPDPTDAGLVSPVSYRASSAPSNLSPSHVPDLVSSHSRNPSNASSVFSLASCGSLSRNPSTSSSRHPNASSVLIDDAIMEVDGEDADAISVRSTLKASASASRGRRGRSASSAAAAAKAAAAAAASSNVMHVHDMLDELINMEQSFRVSESPEPQEHLASPSPSTPVQQFTPLHGRPPRTPSPVLGQSSVPPPAPSGPDRRGSLIHTRPSSTFAHQSSLSESHTALYLATASPMPSKNSRQRRSASPKLHMRRSITFTPSAAGPSLSGRAPRNRVDSPGVTPVRSKHLTPTAHHPAMDGWRFPTSNNATPTRPAFTTPTPGEPVSPIQPTLLWPVAQNDHLQPAWAPGRPRANTTISPPRSSLRLGDLIRSSSTDLDMDTDDRSTAVRGSILMAPAPPFAQRGW